MDAKLMEPKYVDGPKGFPVLNWEVRSDDGTLISTPKNPKAIILTAEADADGIVGFWVFGHCEDHPENIATIARACSHSIARDERKANHPHQLFSIAIRPNGRVAADGTDFKGDPEMLAMLGKAANSICSSDPVKDEFEPDEFIERFNAQLTRLEAADAARRNLDPLWLQKWLTDRTDPLDGIEFQNIGGVMIGTKTIH